MDQTVGALALDVRRQLDVRLGEQIDLTLPHNRLERVQEQTFVPPLIFQQVLCVPSNGIDVRSSLMVVQGFEGQQDGATVRRVDTCSHRARTKRNQSRSSNAARVQRRQDQTPSTPTSMGCVSGSSLPARLGGFFLAPRIHLPSVLEALCLAVCDTQQGQGQKESLVYCMVCDEELVLQSLPLYTHKEGLDGIRCEDS